MGWYLTLVDTLCKEYGSVSPAEVKLRMPLAEAFALFAAIDARRSQGSGPTYEAIELMDAISEMEGL